MSTDAGAGPATAHSPGISWIGSRMNRSDSFVQLLQMYSYGQRPFRILSLRPKS